MNKLVKIGLGIIGIDLAASTIVAVKNSAEENRETDSKHHKGFYEKYVKRPMDFFLASGAFVVLSPVLAGTAIAVRAKLGSPVLFTQDRPGKNERIFKLYKFRTMTDERDSDGKLMPDIVRLTPFGKRLRASSLDELPELINIIKGDMSIIGPRPLAVQYLPYYNSKERQRHSVSPGLSGLAQVNGRTAVNWEDRFAYDIEYVNNISFLADCKILLKTVSKVIKRADIVEAGSQGDFDKYRINQIK